MANNIEDIAKSLDIEIKLPTGNKMPPTENKKPVFGRRRSWMEHESVSKGVDQPDLKGVDQPLLSKGSINRVNKPIQIKLENLVSNPRKIILFLYKISFVDSLRITSRISKKEIAMELNIPFDSVKTALKFLIEHKCISKADIVVGKGGWVKYKINDILLSEIDLIYERTEKLVKKVCQKNNQIRDIELIDTIRQQHN